MFTKILRAGFALSLAVSCACHKAPHTPRSTPPPPQDFHHTVRYQGETLAALARWYTGSSSNWQAIKNANPTLDPKRLRPGVDVVIPEDLLVRTDPFPKPAGSPKKSEPPSTAPSTAASSGQPSQPPTETEPPMDGDAGTGSTVSAPSEPPPPAVDIPAEPPAPPATNEGSNPPPSGGTQGGVVGGLLEAVGKIAIENQKQAPPPGQ